MSDYNVGAVVSTCDDCAAGLSNGDWSHLDMHTPEYKEETEVRITAFEEQRRGWWVRIGRGDDPGYFDCACCGDIAVGESALFRLDG